MTVAQPASKLSTRPVAVQFVGTRWANAPAAIVPVAPVVIVPQTPENSRPFAWMSAKVYPQP